MTATLTAAVALAGATATLTVRDRDADVDATLGALSITGLPSRRWRLSAKIISTPLPGSGPAQSQTVDTGVNATTVALPTSSLYVRVKDVEAKVGGYVLADARLEWWHATSSRWLPYAGRSAQIDYAAPAAVKTSINLGINTHLFSAQMPAEFWRPALDAVVAAGGTWVRTSVPWAYIETARGTRDANMLGMLDTFMTDAGSRGLKVLAITAGGAPGWSTASKATQAANYSPGSWLGVGSYPAVFPGWSFSNTVISGGLPPDAWSDYTNHVTWFVGRYAGGGLAGAGGTALGAVENINEPFASSSLNLTRDGGASTVWANNNAATLAAWQSHLYSAVKAAPGGTGVTVLGLVSAYNDWTLLQNLYNTGAFKGNYDALSVHPYPVTFKTASPRSYDPRFPFGDGNSEWHHHPASLGYFIDVMDANADSVPVWITEFGQSCGDIAHTPLNVSPQEQADHLAYMWRLLARYQRVGAIFMHSIEDSSTGYVREDSNVWGNFGLVQVDHVTRKPAFAAVQNVLAAIKAGTA